MIVDEYDVQDILHALLKLHFHDIRREDPGPTIAGKSPRPDFILKDEEMAIEIKMTRSGLKDGGIGDELLIDIQRYAEHPSCKTLICFIYDPEWLLSNPQGLIKDLESRGKHLNTKVIISR